MSENNKDFEQLRARGLLKTVKTSPKFFRSLKSLRMEHKGTGMGEAVEQLATRVQLDKDPRPLVWDAIDSLKGVTRRRAIGLIKKARPLIMLLRTDLGVEYLKNNIEAILDTLITYDTEEGIEP